MPQSRQRLRGERVSFRQFGQVQVAASTVLVLTGVPLRRCSPTTVGSRCCPEVSLRLPFAVRRGVFQSVGGYLPGLAYSENTELGMRLVDEVADFMEQATRETIALLPHTQITSTLN